MKLSSVILSLKEEQRPFSFTISNYLSRPHLFFIYTNLTHTCYSTHVLCHYPSFLSYYIDIVLGVYHSNERELSLKKIGKLNLEVYTQVNYAGSIDARKSSLLGLLYFPQQKFGYMESRMQKCSHKIEFKTKIFLNTENFLLLRLEVEKVFVY